MKNNSSTALTTTTTPTKRSTTLTDARVKRWQTKFIATLSSSPSVKHAARAAGVTRQTAYTHRSMNAEFAAQWEDAIRQSVDDLEAVAFKLASEGDPNLITFLLRSHRPEIYRETSRRELTGADGRPLTGKILFIPAKVEGAE